MLSFLSPALTSSSTSPSGTPGTPQPSAVDRWHTSAAADDRLARLFADRFDAKLDRTEHSRRVGWVRDGRCVYGILLPDPLPSAHLTDDDWYIYYVWGARRCSAARAGSARS